MTNTQINVDEFLDMFKKADEIAKNDLFVDSERNVYKKSAHPNDWEYDDNFSSLYDYAKCTIDTNMTKYEKIGNYIDLNDPFHFAMNEVVSQIHERVDVGNTFDKFWKTYDNACKTRDETDAEILDLTNKSGGYLYSIEDRFDDLSTETLNKMYDYFCEKLPLFKELSEQMSLSNENERGEFFNELYHIYNHGANTGSNGLIYIADMEDFYDKNEDEMLDFLDEEAKNLGCDSKMEFLSKHVGCDLEDYKWKSVQALAYDNSIGVMEADIRELDLRSDNNSQQSVDENTQNSESKPKIQKK